MNSLAYEAFFKYLKKEEISRKTFHNYTELKQAIFEYIKGHYNSRLLIIVT
jgi:putative transposase